MNADGVLRDLEGLRALARSLVRGDADADDLIQDTAIAALGHLPADDRPTRPWLATVLRNRWRMDRRGEARRRAREEAAAASWLTDRDATEDPVDRARVLQRLASALVALDEPFRSTVIRRYLDGESAADIARTDDLPAGTVRWRLKTGLDRLRSSLDDATPRWQRALAPFALGTEGAVLVKTKSSVIALIVLAVLLAGVAVFVGLHDDPSPATPTVATHARTTAIVAPGPAAGSGPGAAAPGTAATVDPLPGQGRATLERVPLPGGALSGRVINWSTGAGVANAELTFTADGGATTVRTGATGGFELAPPSPGAFALTAVVAAGFLPYAPELQHSSVRIVLEQDRAVRGVTVFLFPAIAYTGKVVDARGAPVAGARVRLAGTPSGEQVIERLETEWTSGADGTFVFHAPDDAVLEATARTAGRTARGWARLDDGVAITRELAITIGDAPARDAAIRGRTIDAAGAPVADVLVRARPQDPPGAGPGRAARPGVPRAVAFATSGPDGTFVLEGLDHGRYELVAEADGHAPISHPGIAGGARDVALVLSAGARIAGAVVTADGAIVPAYTLLAFAKRGLARELITARSIVHPQGRFELRVPDGDYELLASASGWAPSAPLDVRAGDTDAKLVVSTGATLRGVVVSADDGAPVEYARVMREARGGGASALPANAGTVTRRDGTFELAGLPPGPLSITVAAGGHHPRIEGGMTATDGGELGPLTIAMTRLADGEAPTLELVGIGVKLIADGDALRVDGVIPGGGAADAGIVAGDRLVAVDGVAVAKLGMGEAIARIRGVVGTRIAIGVARGDQVVTYLVERKKLAV